MKGGVKVLIFGILFFVISVILNVILLPSYGFQPNTLTYTITSSIILFLLFVGAVMSGRWSK